MHSTRTRLITWLSLAILGTATLLSCDDGEPNREHRETEQTQKEQRDQTADKDAAPAAQQKKADGEHIVEESRLDMSPTWDEETSLIGRCGPRSGELIRVRFGGRRAEAMP